jgi:hypothetical protein
VETAAGPEEWPSQVQKALGLIADVPGYAETARDLRRARIRLDPNLPDRGQASLTGVLTLGPEPFFGEPESVPVALAGTLVHEHWHTRQNPFLKTVSFWGGVLSRTHPMRRYEWPAYARHAAFLQDLSTAHPALREFALREREAVLTSFRSVYGEPPSHLAAQ